MADSRTKGASFEREVCNWLRDWFGGEARRNLTQYQVRDEGDIVYEPFLIECKRYAKGNWHPHAWWEQVLTASKSAGLLPLLIYRFDRQKPRYVFRLSDIGDYPQDDWDTVTVDQRAADIIIRERMSIEADRWQP